MAGDHGYGLARFGYCLEVLKWPLAADLALRYLTGFSGRHCFYAQIARRNGADPQPPDSSEA